MTLEELETIEARANAATPGEQWGQKWDGTLGRGEIRVGPRGAQPTARFAFMAPAFGNAGTAHPDFQLAISAATDVPALVAEVHALRAALVKAHGYAGCADAPGTAPDVCFICRALVGR